MSRRKVPEYAPQPFPGRHAASGVDATAREALAEAGVLSASAGGRAAPAIPPPARRAAPNKLRPSPSHSAKPAEHAPASEAPTSPRASARAPRASDEQHRHTVRLAPKNLEKLAWLTEEMGIDANAAFNVAVDLLYTTRVRVGASLR